jgi:uncharacterized protein YjiS (DUF1127 family)
MACAIRSHRMPFDRSCEHLHDTRRTRLGIKRRLGAIAAVFQLWSQRSRERRALGELDARELADIGITRQAAEREARKWFWH